MNQDKLLEFVSKHLSAFLAQESKFLEISSKELKVNLNNENAIRLFSSLNTSSRIKIIKFLNKGDFSASQIAREINISLPTTLFHLTKLQEVRIIERKNKMYNLKNNKFIFYV